MKRPHYKGRELLPLSVIHAAQAGDAEAMEQILRYYGGYIGSTPQAQTARGGSNRGGNMVK